jgi:8-oxo-dGTP pyrophosphatase MutT (NUDIX family)
MSKHYKRLARRNGAGTQYGALAWRRTGDALEVMLITSRETQRWTVPKGWPVKKLGPAETAALEAFEEAGVKGPLAPSIGRYRYSKRLRDGSVVICTVELFPLEVTREEDVWAEAAERGRAWFAPAGAAALVGEPELKALILAFEPAPSR